MFGTRMCGQTLLFTVIANCAIAKPKKKHRNINPGSNKLRKYTTFPTENHHHLTCVIPGIGCRTVGAKLLNVHAKETHVDAVDLLEGKDGLGQVREAVGHLWLGAVRPRSTELGLHARSHLDNLLRARQHADCHVTRARVLALQKQVDPVLQVRPQLCLRQPYIITSATLVYRPSSTTTQGS